MRKLLKIKVLCNGNDFVLETLVWFNTTPREILEKAGLFGYGLLSPEGKELERDNPKFYWLIRDGEELTAFREEVMDGT